MHSFSIFAQEELDLTIGILGNEKIVDVNLNKEKFIKSISDVIDVIKKEYASIPKNQKVAIVIDFQKSGFPKFDFHFNPKMESKLEEKVITKINQLNIENPKFVNFPILILINSKYENSKNYFDELILPNENINKQYINASLKEKFDLNKKYATEIIPLLAAYQINVDDQFSGVKGFGNQINDLNFNDKQDEFKLTSQNSNYWRASMEMAVGNQLIPITKVFILASQGEFDQALKYMEILIAFSDPKTIPNDYLNELMDRIQTFQKELNEKIQKGIIEHDKENYKEAIAIYQSILQEYPNSAWAKYELYYSNNALKIKNNEIKIDDRTDWDSIKADIYKSNPLYNMNVRASNGKEGYLMFRRAEIGNLFQKKEERINDLIKYANIAMDLEVYDFAAQLFWLTNNYKNEEKNLIFKYLYCLEKLGVTDLKELFKGDYKKEFKKIENEKDKEMKNSKIYNTFKDK